MVFEIVEMFVEGKSKDASECEDRIVVCDGFVCVVDGVTSKSGIGFGGNKQGGVVAGEIVEAALCGLPEDSGVSVFIDAVNSGFARFYEANGLAGHMANHPVYRPAASAAVFSAHRKEVLLIGDCQALVNGIVVTNPKLVDSVLADMRAFVIEALLAQGATAGELLARDLGREAVLPYLRQQSVFQNNHFGSVFSYAVLDGFPVDGRQVKVHAVDGGGCVVLAIDGYPALFGSLADSEEWLRRVLTDDPLCHRVHKSTKGLAEGNRSFDDRAYVKLQVS